MKPGALGQLHLDLRDRLRLASAEQRRSLASVWARRALHVHLTAALAVKGAPNANPRLAGWLGPIDSPDAVARALTVVDRLLNELGPPKALGPPYRADNPDRARGQARLACSAAKTVLENYVEDIDAEQFARLAWAALMLAEAAGCYLEEERQMLADAGGAADA